MKIKHLFSFLIAASSINLSIVDAAETRWSIDGDSAKNDLGKKIFRYIGNARFENDLYLIKGETLEAFQSRELDKRYVRVEGAPATLIRKTQQEGRLELTAKTINYRAKSQRLSSSEEVVLTLKNSEGTLKLKGNNLQVSDGAKGKIYIEGTPSQLSLNQSESSISATALKIEFDQTTQIFTLLGDIELKTERESISAAKIIYDMKNKTLEIPKVPNKRAKMIQKVKS